MRRRYTPQDLRDLPEMLREKLNLPDDVIDRAWEIFETAKGMGFLRGRSAVQVMATAVYAACREYGIHRPLIGFRLEHLYPAPYSIIVSHRVIARTYNKLVRLLGLKVQPETPQKYLHMIADRLRLSREDVEKAERLLEAAKGQSRFAMTKPVVLAAAAVYLVSNADIRDVRRASGVATPTIKKYAAALSDLTTQETR